MPIDQIDTTAKTITSVCMNCGHDVVADLNKLELGTADSADTIVLPACSNCGSQEYLFRTWDNKVDAPHRRAINGLAEFLKSKGQSNKAQKKVHADEKAANKAPPFLMDVAAKLDDLTGRKASAAQAQKAADEKKAPPPAQPDPTPAPPVDDATANQMFAAAQAKRTAAAKASVNKRLGLPPGSEPPAQELAAELQKNATEFQK